MGHRRERVRECRSGAGLVAEKRALIVRYDDFSGLKTQNSLLSGSAMTTQPTSPCPISIRDAPSSMRRSISRSGPLRTDRDAGILETAPGVLSPVK